jgi:hypothetical protein
MKPNRQLANLIIRMEVGREPHQAPPGAAVVRIDPATGAEATSGLLGWLRTHDTYVVTLDKPTALEQATVSVRDSQTGERVELGYRTSILIRKENAVRAVSTWLAGSADYPNDVIGSILQRWVDGLGAEEHLGLKERLALNSPLLRNVVADKIRDALGLEASISFEIDEQAILNPRTFDTTRFSIRLSDYRTKEFPFRVEATISRLSRPKKPEPHDDIGWARLLRNVTIAICDESVSLHAYYFDRKQLVGLISDQFTSAIADFGRKLDRLNIFDLEEPPFRLESPVVRTAVSWSSPTGKSVNFNVEARFRIGDGQAAVYAANGAPALRDWLKDAVEFDVQAILLGRDLLDLTRETLAELRDALKQRLIPTARSIGLEVEFFVADPILKEWRYLQDFEVPVPAQRYETRDPGNPVACAIIVIGRLGSLARVRQFLDPDDIIEDRIREAAVNAAARHIRAIPLDMLYANFERDSDRWNLVAPGTVEANGAVSFSRQISEQIGAELLQRFGMICAPDAIDVRLDDAEHRQKQGEIARQDPIEVNVVVEPRDLRSPHDRVPVALRFFIEAVSKHRVTNLLQRDYDRGRFSTQLKEWTEQCLRTFAHDELTTPEQLQQDVVRRHVTETVGRRSIEYFGIEVTVMSITPGESERMRLRRRSEGLSFVASDAETELHEERIRTAKEIEKQRMRSLARQSSLLDEQAEKLVANLDADAELVQRHEQKRISVDESIKRQSSGLAALDKPADHQPSSAPAESRPTIEDL